MVEPSHAEEFLETIISNETARPPGSERAAADNETMGDLLNLLGKKHTIVLLHQFSTGDGPLRYGDLEAAVDIAPNTLSNRLEQLTDVGLLTRTAYDEIPPRIEYDATEKARELAPCSGTWPSGPHVTISGGIQMVASSSERTRP